MIQGESGYLSDEELAIVTAKHNTQVFKSNLNVLNDHNGFQKGELHLVVAPSGGGKSTFIRTIVFELIRAHKVFLYLSEEPRESYVKSLNAAYSEAVKGSTNPDRERFLQNLKVMTELDLEEDYKKHFFKILKDEILDHGTEVFIFDNITTSFLDTLGISHAPKVIAFFKRLANELNIAVIMVVHTQKGTTLAKGAFSSENVRGNASSALMGSYVYVVMVVHSDAGTRSFVVTDKARYHPHANKRVYEMNFDKTLGLITRDLRSTHGLLSKAINDANDELKPKKQAGQKSSWGKRE